MKQKTSNPFLEGTDSFTEWDKGYNSTEEAATLAVSSAWQLGKKAHQEDTKAIPLGSYCYHGSRAPGDSAYEPCPYWSASRSKEGDIVGSCSFLNTQDGKGGFDLLWDQVKECDENLDD